MSCSDCTMSEVMADGSLFCALHEHGVHGDDDCGDWISDPDLFIEVEEKGYGFGRNREQRERNVL